MCGINGILKRTRDLSVRIENMNQSLVHRGPDSEGVFIDMEHGVALGHRRLSIIDVAERSIQPMISNSERWVITYNGEIYNYLDLKCKTSYPYKTNSDTEVILANIECYGVKDFLEKSNGMFAFAVYDKLKKELFLCRDRMGIKPLYYYLDENQMVFSSEVKGILHSGLVEAVLDEDSIDDYLGYRYVREPYTFFKNIYQVPAGSFIRIDMDFKLEVNYYWKIPTAFNLDQNYNEKKIKCDFLERLEKATVKRMVSDVSLGTYLSGGVDSGILTAIVSNNMKEQLHTFTAGFQELNEFEYSDLVSEQYCTRNHKTTISAEEYFQNMQDLILYKDAPLGVPNEIALALMSKELKKYITVVISGEGADELLGGYGKIYRSPFEYLGHEEEMDFYDFFIKKYEYVPRKMRDTFLDVSIKRRKEFDLMIKQSFCGKRNEQNVFMFFHKYHIKGLLQRLDTTTMLASVEARVPYLDHELIKYSYEEVPYELKLRWKNEEAMSNARGMTADLFSEIYDTPKYLLKEVARDFIPQKVIERRKMGFPVPLGQWDMELKKMLLERSTDECFWIKDGAIEDLINGCTGYSNGSQLLWMFLNLQIFYDTYFNKKWTY